MRTFWTTLSTTALGASFLLCGLASAQEPQTHYAGRKYVVQTAFSGGRCTAIVGMGQRHKVAVGDHIRVGDRTGTVLDVYPGRSKVTFKARNEEDCGRPSKWGEDLNLVIGPVVLVPPAQLCKQRIRKLRAAGHRVDKTRKALGKCRVGAKQVTYRTKAGEKSCAAWMCLRGGSPKVEADKKAPKVAPRGPRGEVQRLE